MVIILIIIVIIIIAIAAIKFEIEISQLIRFKTSISEASVSENKYETLLSNYMKALAFGNCIMQFQAS